MPSSFGRRGAVWTLAVMASAAAAGAAPAAAGATASVAETLAADHAAIREALAVAEREAAETRRLDVVDAGAIGAVAEVLSGLVETCHLPWEEKVVFPAVSAAGSPQRRVVVAHLEKAHAEAAVLLRDVRWQLARVRAGEAVAAPLVADDLDALAQLLRDHMKDEENEIVPALAAAGRERAGDGETASESRCRERYRGLLAALEDRRSERKDGRP